MSYIYIYTDTFTHTIETTWELAVVHHSKGSSAALLLGTIYIILDCIVGLEEDSLASEVYAQTREIVVCKCGVA